MRTDFTGVKHIHFVGLKGVAMTALALWAKEAGYYITGSDVQQEFPTDELISSAHIECKNGFSHKHIMGADLIIYTGAHGGQDNIEVVSAKEIGVKALPHGKALGIAMQGKKQISIAGCHGKTTTAGMVATVLVHAGVDPSYAIGCGTIRGLGNPGHFGKGDLFIAEADEYATDIHHDNTPRFLWQQPYILVVTNIDFDHPDLYSDIKQIQNAYKKLAQKCLGKCILNYDDPNSHMLKNIGGQNSCLVGFGSGADALIIKHNPRNKTNSFSIQYENKILGPFSLAVFGTQNIQNAALAIMALYHLGLPIKKIQEGIKLFGGAKRRFEEIDSYNGITIIDDYAHHPKEIEATLSAAKEKYPKNRIVVVFQPHTISRTKALLNDFSHCFSLADIVCVTDIYQSAREKSDKNITASFFAKAVALYHKDVHAAQTYIKVEKKLFNIVKKGDLVLFLGAGDIGLWGKKFSDFLRREQKK